MGTVSTISNSSLLVLDRSVGQLEKITNWELLNVSFSCKINSICASHQCPQIRRFLLHTFIFNYLSLSTSQTGKAEQFSSYVLFRRNWKLEKIGRKTSCPNYSIPPTSF